MKVPIPETVTGTPAPAVSGVNPLALTVSVPELAVNVIVELIPDAIPQTAVVSVVVTV
jgi:hypothetical protein